MLVLACLYYLFLLTNGRFELLSEEALGLVYNDMAVRLLHFDFTISSDLIGREAFRSNGSTYTYFGIFPAVLRMPFVLVPGWHWLPMSRVSCWIALSLSAWAQASLLLHIQEQLPPRRSFFAWYGMALVALLFTGPQLGMTFTAWIYNEPILWSALFLLCSVRLIGIRLIHGQRLRHTDWLALGLLAGLGCSARPTDGLAMGCGAAAVALIEWLRDGAQLHSPNAAVRDGLKFIFGRGVHLFVLGLLPFIAFVLAVNWGRWGNPLQFMPYQLHVQIMENPRRAAVYRDTGMFSVWRMPVAISYYFAGLPERQLLQPFLDRYFDDVAWPRSLFILTSSAPLLLGVVGSWLAATGHSLATRPLLILLVAPCVNALLLLMLSFLNYRYRFEFVPLLFVGTVLGVSAARDLRVAGLRAMSIVVAGLVVINIGISHLDLLQAKLASFANPDNVRAQIIRDTAPVSNLLVH